MMWRKPVIRHTEQLQSSAGTGGSGNFRLEPHRAAMTSARSLSWQRRSAAGGASEGRRGSELQRLPSG